MSGMMGEQKAERDSFLEAPSREVGIVVVNHNSALDFEQLLDSLQGSKERGFYVLVLDSGSQADDRGRLRTLQRFYDFEIQFLPDNVGFAAAVNVGLRYLSSCGFRYVWLLNPDMRIEPESLGELLKFTRENAGPRFIVGSKVLWGENMPLPGRVWGCGGQVDIAARKVSMYGHGEIDSPSNSEPCRVDYIPGCSLFFSLGDLEKCGYFPEEYFLYFEETEWCVRAKSRGFELMIVPTSRVWHFFDKEKTSNPRTVYYYNRNEKRFWRGLSPLSGRVSLWFQTLFVDLPRVQYAIFRSSDQFQLAQFRAQRLAYLHFLLSRQGRLAV